MSDKDKPDPNKPVHHVFGWVEPEDVLSAMGMSPYDQIDRVWLVTVCNAVNTAIAYWRPDLKVPEGDRAGAYSYEFTVAYDRVHSELRNNNPMVAMGAIMLASRWYSRRGSNEVAAYAEFGGMPPVLDRDLELLLGINRAHAPVIA